MGTDDATVDELRAELARARAWARAWKTLAYYREQEAWASEGSPEPKHYPDEARAHAYKKELRRLERRLRIETRYPMPWVVDRRDKLAAWLEEYRWR